MSRDWYKDHPLSPEAYPDSVYLDWAQDNGLYADAAGNVDCGPPEPCSEERDPYPNPWERWLGFVPGEREPWIGDDA
jgi:hypothetical protein